MFCFLKNLFKNKKITDRQLLELIMATVEEIKVVLNEVKENNSEVSGKVDVVIEKLNACQTGGGATPDQLSELLELANEVKAGVQGSEDKLDAANT
jgi:hypothetical protein